MPEFLNLLEFLQYFGMLASFFRRFCSVWFIFQNQTFKNIRKKATVKATGQIILQIWIIFNFTAHVYSSGLL